MDREKVIKDIEECLSASCRGFRPRESCPYNDDEWDIMRDALALIKEQEAAYQGAVELLRQKTILFDDAIKRLKEQEAVSVDVCGHISTVKYGHCPTCNEGLNSEVYPHWCGYCGQAVKWE